MDASEHPYAAFLSKVDKPGRYLGGEEQATTKPASADLCARFCLAFPDLYEVGMSHLGTRIIYDLVNGHDDLVCERAFSPWGDMEAELRARDLPLVSLESYTPLSEFDAVGVSLQYELSYTNVLLNLELGGITLRSADRRDDEPVVIAGGPTATHPEPLAPFVDVFLVGEAEEVLPAMLRVIGRGRKAGHARAEILAALAGLPGVYIPAFYAVDTEPRTGLQVVVGRTPAGVAAGAPARVDRVWVRNLDDFPFPDRFPIPYAEAIFDRAAVEITRGCTEGCRFCQAGIIYRPVRERSPKQIVRSVLAGMDNAGYAETSLTALSTADVSCIDPLIKELVPALAERKAKLGVASLRAYGLNGELLDEIKRVGITGLTFAPEAGTQRMRDVINKNVSEQDILDSAKRIFERGYDRMKVYFIMGLPTETDEDVVGIVETGRRCRNVARELGLPRMPQVTVSVSQHVPKPHTPFQWAAMDSMEDLETKCRMLRDLARRAKVGLKTHDVRHSWLECLFARGDRVLGDALEYAYRAGARFDGWAECFSFDRWLDALAAAKIEPSRYTTTLPVGARLPWDHIDVGVDPDFLAAEWRKAVRGRVSPPCGKPVGAKVHPRSEAEAREQTQGKSGRLVCYDCGVACDMTQMRDERIVALRQLSKMTDQRLAAEPAAEVPHNEGIADVPLQRLQKRLAPSNLDDGSAWKAAAEAPFSRLRLLFAKKDATRFWGHRDLLRVLPRMFRRARIELGFSRGYRPNPRMTFGPALALGVEADEEVVDVDILLPESAADMEGTLVADDRDRLAARLIEQLSAVAPPGLHIVGGRLVGPGERRLGTLIAAADYEVQVGAQTAASVDARLRSGLLDAPVWVDRALRTGRRRTGRRRLTGQVQRLDARQTLLSADADPTAGLVRLRLRLDGQGGARLREVVAAVCGDAVPEVQIRRRALLALRGEDYVTMGRLGPMPRTVSVARAPERIAVSP